MLKILKPYIYLVYRLSTHGNTKSEFNINDVILYKPTQALDQRRREIIALKCENLPICVHTVRLE